MFWPGCPSLQGSRCEDEFVYESFYRLYFTSFCMCKYKSVNILSLLVLRKLKRPFRTNFSPFVTLNITTTTPLWAKKKADIQGVNDRSNASLYPCRPIIPRLTYNINYELVRRQVLSVSDNYFCHHDCVIQAALNLDLKWPNVINLTARSVYNLTVIIL